MTYSYLIGFIHLLNLNFTQYIFFSIFAGLITAERICNRWNGQIIEEFIGIELNGKTVPHRIHVIDLPRT